jgi:multidrug efflux pump subunit AcrB
MGGNQNTGTVKMNGPIAWFTRNGVAANLLMVAILAFGVHALLRPLATDILPDAQLDLITVNVPYRGSTPVESEEGVVLRIEEAIHDLEGIKHLHSTASPGIGSVTIEVETGYDTRLLLDDVKARVDAISTFPAETEKPIISIPQIKIPVVMVVISAEMPERGLRRLGEVVRDRITDLPGISQTQLLGVRPYEIAIEVTEETLERYGLTMSQISQAIARSSIDIPAGSIKARHGNILLRTEGQAYFGEDFRDIVVLTNPDGSRVTLNEIATITDGFDETPALVRFDGKPCVMVQISRVGDQDSVKISETIKGFFEGDGAGLVPSGVEVHFFGDTSVIVSDRLDTLKSSAIFGFLLVLVVLALFLRPSLAFYIAIGIPISLMGAIGLMPYLGVTINLISLFGFILVLGIVVDDAIVTGENIYHNFALQPDTETAAIIGAKQVAVPVIFGVLTTVAAFAPMLMVEGVAGKLFAPIPLVVIPVLIFSLIESKFILPAHLKHLRRLDRSDDKIGILEKTRRFFSNGLERFALRVYQPALAIAARHRYTTAAGFLACLIILTALVFSNRVRWVFMPTVEGDRVQVSLTMPDGTSAETTISYLERISQAAVELQKEYHDEERGSSVITGILAYNLSESRGKVDIELLPGQQRDGIVTVKELERQWREKVGVLPGVEEIRYSGEAKGNGGGPPVQIRLTGQDFDELAAASDEVKELLAKIPHLSDISDSYDAGKEEVKLSIKPEAEALGLTTNDLARQTREAFFGAESQRIQRGREDVRVMVRYPREQRSSITQLNRMRIRTPDGSEVPFSAVANATIGPGFTSIRRIDRNRSINITADANKEKANMGALQKELAEQLPKIVAKYPGMGHSFEGEAREQSDAFRSLSIGALFVAFLIFALLAIPLKSYLQPFIVMSAIPFGLAGAIIGHMIMGHPLSIISLFGLLALAGVVVNDSLVMVDYINGRRREGMALHEAVIKAGGARFRAIMLTSVTTFAALIPMMFETSLQAQFLIPMAISLGYGILFSTLITLFLVPINFLILEDLKKCWRWYWSDSTAHARE